MTRKLTRIHASVAVHLACLIPFLAVPALAAPHLELSVKLDPASRQLGAEALLSDPDGLAGFRLAPGFSIREIRIDGRAQDAERLRPRGRVGYVLPRGSRRVELRYEGRLAPLQALDHREVLGSAAASADPDGSFLPGAAGWYPDPGGHFSYRVRLDLPPGQKGLVAGNLLNEADDGQGYRAEFEFPHPAEGIDLMAGPYRVRERNLDLPGRQAVRIRTWFHADLAADGGLAQAYLDDSARYLARYSRLLGAYPFSLFSIVSSPTPTGFGMPSLTYLGRDVIRLPFIRATSLGHEALHNWWGNGVYPDWRRGNWSEGLTTFLADYAYKEDEGEDAARAQRLAWLRDLAAIPAREETALKDFVSRQHGIAAIVGYNKSAMLFFMLRDEIGAEAFAAGLRELWREKRFQVAHWGDLEAAFSRAAGRDLRDFFRQWLARADSPELRLEAAELSGQRLHLRFRVPPGYDLNVPIRLDYGERSETRRVRVGTRQNSVSLKVAEAPRAVELDPEYRLWRRLDPAGLPPILREVFVAPRVGLVVVDDEEDDGLREGAARLAGRLLDHPPTALDARHRIHPNLPRLVIGSDAAVARWRTENGFTSAPGLSGAGSARVWAERDLNSEALVFIAVRDRAALDALQRPLPHYGRQSWLAFDGNRVLDKGVWPPLPGRDRIAVSTLAR